MPGIEKQTLLSFPLVTSKATKRKETPLQDKYLFQTWLKQTWPTDFPLSPTPPPASYRCDHIHCSVYLHSLHMGSYNNPLNPTVSNLCQSIFPPNQAIIPDYIILCLKLFINLPFPPPTFTHHTPQDYRCAPNFMQCCWGWNPEPLQVNYGLSLIICLLKFK